MKSPLPKQWIRQKLQPALKITGQSCCTPASPPKDICQGEASDRISRGLTAGGFDSLPLAPTVRLSSLGDSRPVEGRLGRQSPTESSQLVVNERRVASGYPTRAPFPSMGSGGSMLWSLNRYRFGRLDGTSISPHGVRTHPPSAGSGRGVVGAYRADVGS